MAFSVWPLGKAYDVGTGSMAWASGGRARAVRFFSSTVSATEPAAVDPISTTGQ